MIAYRVIRFMKAIVSIVSLGMLLVFTSCVTLYKPNAIHSPLLKEKGDFSTSAVLGASGCGIYNLQAAYAVSEHVGILTDGMFHNRRITSSDSSVEKLHILSGEIWAGYFTRIDNVNNALFQCYGGVGTGFTKDRITKTHQSSPEINSKYFNLFVQPGIAYTYKYFEAAFDVRANYVQIYDIHAYLYDKFEWWNTDFRFYNDTTVNFLILEPSITLKAGGEKLKGVFQFGVTIPTIHSDSYFYVTPEAMFGTPLIKFSFGINYTLGKK